MGEGSRFPLISAYGDGLVKIYFPKVSWPVHYSILRTPSFLFSFLFSFFFFLFFFSCSFYLFSPSSPPPFDVEEEISCDHSVAVGGGRGCEPRRCRLAKSLLSPPLSSPEPTHFNYLTSLGSSTSCSCSSSFPFFSRLGSVCRVCDSDIGNEAYQRRVLWLGGGGVTHIKGCAGGHSRVRPVQRHAGSRQEGMPPPSFTWCWLRPIDLSPLFDCSLVLPALVPADRFRLWDFVPVKIWLKIHPMDLDLIESPNEREVFDNPPTPIAVSIVRFFWMMTTLLVIAWEILDELYCWMGEWQTDPVFFFSL